MSATAKPSRLFDALATAALDFGIEPEGIAVGEDKDGGVLLVLEHEDRIGSIPIDKAAAGRSADSHSEAAQRATRSLAAMLAVPLSALPGPA